jgi:adenylate cyclase
VKTSTDTSWHGWQRTVVVVLPALLCAGHVLGFWSLGLVQRVDGWLHDQAVQIAASERPDNRVVIVAIDENSLADWGRWPWPRQRMAELVDALFDDQGVAVVGMDMVFAEPDTGDKRLAQALNNRPVVLGQYFTNEAGARQTGSLGPRLPGDPVVHHPLNTWTQWAAYGANQAVLTAAVDTAGHFNALLDADGVVRSMPAVVEHDGQWHEALALGIYRRWKKMPAWRVQTMPWGAAQAVQAIVPTSSQHPTWRLGERAGLVVPYRGKPGQVFEQVSATDIVKGRLARQTLQGAVVLVGATAPGLMDRQSTPMGINVPGVEIHAHMVSALMDGRVWVRPVFAPIAVAFTLLLMLVGALVYLPRLGWRGTWVLALSSWGALVSVAVGVWAALGWVLPLAAALLMVWLMLVFKLAWGFALESQARSVVWQKLRRYFPAQRWEVMRRATDSPVQAPLVEREMTVMFCDWQGFTTLAERVTPHRLQRLLNHVLGEITEAVEAQGGTVDKYMGDCVMAFWGAPQANRHHARDAVTSALRIVSLIESQTASDKYPELLGLGVTIGIHTGTMLVGDMGSTHRQSYTVVGDAVNVAARLQSQCADQGVRILVSASTADQNPLVDWKPLGELRLKGRQQSVATLTPIVINQPERRP